MPESRPVDGDRHQLMWLREVLRSLARRWYLVLLFLGAVGGATYSVYQWVPASFAAQGTLVLMPPKSSVEPDGNPYLYLAGMGQALDVLTSKVSAPEVKEPLVDAHPEVTFTVEPDRSSSGSVVLVTVRGPDSGKVMAALPAVMAAVPESLSALQQAQSVALNSRITLMPLVVDSKPKMDTKNRTVFTVAVAGAGGALSILLTGFIDGRLLARRAGLAAVGAEQESASERPTDPGHKDAEPEHPEPEHAEPEHPEREEAAPTEVPAALRGSVPAPFQG